MNEFTEEPVPKHVIGVHDPVIDVAYWVFSDFPIPFEQAKQRVSEFMAERSREYSLDYEKIYDLPREVILVCDQQNRVTSRHLQSPEQLKIRRDALKEKMEKLKNRHPPIS